MCKRPQEKFLSPFSLLYPYPRYSTITRLALANEFALLSEVEKLAVDSPQKPVQVCRD